MGVEYDANFGLGYQISEDQIERLTEDPVWDEKWDGDAGCWLDNLLEGSPYSWIEWGDSNYTGDANSYAITLCHSLVETVQKDLMKLMQFMVYAGLRLEDPSDFCPGGLHVC